MTASITTTGQRTTPGLPSRVAIALRDGARLCLRPIRSEDQDRLIAFYDRLSRHTAYQRFFTVMKRLPPDWAHLLANVDYQSRLALIGEHGPVEARAWGQPRFTGRRR